MLISDFLTAMLYFLKLEVLCLLIPIKLTQSLRHQALLLGAVFVMSLCCAVLISSEFMPVGLLTPIALDLKMSEGQVGQAIAISGIFAVMAV